MPRTIIVGAGVTGQEVAKRLDDPVIIESDVEKATTLKRELGDIRVVVGDATDERTLLQAGISEAKSLLVCVGNDRDEDGVWHGAPSDPPYYNYHDDLPGTQGAPGRYRNRVDFMAHDHIGGKTVLYLIDGILAGRNWEAVPEPWKLPPEPSPWIRHSR